MKLYCMALLIALLEGVCPQMPDPARSGTNQKAPAQPQGVVPANCPNMCTCDPRDQSITCKREGFTAVPAEIPNQVVTLRLVQDKISIVNRKDFAGLTRLNYLNMNNNQITSIAPGSFRDLIRLNGLRLSGNRLQLLPRGVFQGLANLTKLHVDGNQLVLLIDNLFQDLTSLEVLDISSNPIVFVSPRAFYGLVSLRQLFMTGNNLTAMPSKAFYYIQNLKWLTFQQMPAMAVTGDTFQYLPLLQNLDLSRSYSLSSISDDGLNQMNLSMLILNNCNFSAVPSNAFSGLENLLILQLSYNPIYEIQPYAFKNLTSLQELMLDNMQLRFVNRSAFRGLPNLQTLNITYNKLAYLRQSSFDSNPSVVKLCMEGNPWDCGSCDMRWLDFIPDWCTNNVTCINPPNLKNQNLLDYIPRLKMDTSRCIKPEVTIRQGGYVCFPERSTAVLHCNASGSPEPSIIWIGPDRTILRAPSLVSNMAVSEFGTLRIYRISPSHEGTYSCMAHNVVGNKTAYIDVTVEPMTTLAPTPSPPTVKDNSSASAGAQLDNKTTLTTILASFMGCFSFFGVVLLCCFIFSVWSRGKNYKQDGIEMTYVPNRQPENNVNMIPNPRKENNAARVRMDMKFSRI
ncbi:Leucine-rich repeat and immunoglobulin-like domain-containing nogo receptor-interacting protein 2 [Branchiostoma belcheri]|nr:Leucine-rich repeat and immunoglobulin-like domain-containing nogo receptor-interacting protein 2 [Branchiostoma belcheri]